MRAEIENYIKKIEQSLDLIWRSLDIEALTVRLTELEELTADPNLWNNNANAQTLLREKNNLEEKLNVFNKLKSNLKEILELEAMAEVENDLETLNQIEQDFKKLSIITAKFETECLFSGETDCNNCFLEINAGAGGTESHDWASIMMRMYLRFAERLGFKTKIINMINGEEVGIKSCTIRIIGKRAYGWFKTESGVHRLVRISPFNAAGKRMTSFASSWIYPEIDDDIAITIEDKDLRIDTFRSSGAGGQHVNTTDSAVRITHIPTNTVTQCQSDRSQHKNKAQAMKMLQAKLYKLEMQKRNENVDKQNANKTDNSWGHQIRSYVLQPYQIVKDLRTNYETSDTKGVLDGNLEDFVSASLSMNNSGNKT
ncbi:peptide chain release factor 2 [Rickettsia prowazekii]|uniref:Peptide chain release factor 2 n=1 Tax=Rickettsia prowazekii (strain Madrid E) TaxID=272947 RepID=RF2_RICPR|nr:peptide chain release factor 2 [Rickettsia prowazekii]Q9ZDQ2.1 RecName: Full=Peptide chain release factor 2; Short=RF-2 [Rickettsia prowazekii str. Madrid E]CAA14736.1 PEPTIDE CHAIN RELEASE FACTOR 2 (prfB) [Rickettsia prowazekii str. Madrid E]